VFSIAVVNAMTSLVILSSPNRIAKHFFENVESGVTVTDIARVLLELIFIRNGAVWVDRLMR